MGVYATVHICIDRAQPLPVETRAAVVELAIKYELITRECAVSVPKPMPIRGAIDAIKALFGVRKMYKEPVEKGEPGSWVAERVRATAPVFSVSSPFPKWKGESLTGPFVYTCYARPATSCTSRTTAGAAAFRAVVARRPATAFPGQPDPPATRTCRGS